MPLPSSVDLAFSKMSQSAISPVLFGAMLTAVLPLHCELACCGDDVFRGDPGGGRTLAAQFQAALANVAAVVEEAGGRVADVGRLTIYVTDMEAYRGSLAAVGAAYRTVFGKHFPAMALVAVTELVDPRAVVEVEATAVIAQAQPGGESAIDLPIAKEQP